MRIRVDNDKAIVRFNSWMEREQFINVMFDVWNRFKHVKMVRNYGAIKKELKPEVKKDDKRGNRKTGTKS